MNEVRDDELTPLAEAVSDGSAVDWEAETHRRPHLEPVVRELQVLETLAGVFRETEAGEETATGAVVAAVAPPPSIGAWGSLLLLEKIGEGGFGEVYRAYDPGLQREVALKLVRDERLDDPDAADRFLAEARRLARVRHPNVVTIHGVDRHDGTIGIWTDLIVGHTLESLLDRQGPFGAHEAAGIGIELCRALAAVHLAGLVHGDVKTGNVMREHGGRIVLMDFGAARELSQAGGPTRGTPLTMAPELLTGARATAAADIYSLGVLLYRLTTAQFPFQAGTLEELKERLAADDWIPLRTRRPDLPAGFVQVVNRAMEPESGRRFASAAAMERALAGIGPAIPWPGWLWIAVATLLAATAIVIWRMQGPPTPATTASAPKSAASPASTTLALGPGARTSALAPTATLHRRRVSEEVTLFPGDRVAPGDALYLEFTSAVPAYVYVLNEDENGAAFVLFPAPDLDLVNPLSAGRAHRLPGKRRGEGFNWEVTSAGGSETIVVLASRVPVPSLERGLSELPAASPDRPVDSGAEAVRGIGGMQRATGSTPGQAGRLAGILEQAATGPEAPWVWRIRLENSRP